MKSVIHQGGKVVFPEFKGERHYMVGFTKAEGLPQALKHWQPTVDSMLNGIEAEKKIFLMVDQGEVKAGQTLRRPGVHVDGYWLENGHGHTISCHGTYPGHSSVPSRGRHNTGSHIHLRNKGVDELLILAADVYGCDGFEGDWDESLIGAGGGLRDSLDGMHRVRMVPGYAYVSDVFMPHVSVPMTQDVKRTVVRLNVQL